MPEQVQCERGLGPIGLLVSIVLHGRRNLRFFGNLAEKASCVEDKTIGVRDGGGGGGAGGRGQLPPPNSGSFGRESKLFGQNTIGLPRPTCLKKKRIRDCYCSSGKHFCYYPPPNGCWPVRLWIKLFCFATHRPILISCCF